MIKTIWFDIDNAPHVQIFFPVIKEFASEYRILITARDYGQTLELLSFGKIEYTLIGKHPGKNLTKKVLGSIFRAFQLVLWARNKNIDLGVSLGSGAMAIACWLLRIRSLVFVDYEHAEHFIEMNLGSYIYVPSYLGKKYLVNIGFQANKIPCIVPHLLLGEGRH